MILNYPRETGIIKFKANHSLIYLTFKVSGTYIMQDVYLHIILSQILILQTRISIILS